MERDEKGMCVASLKDDKVGFQSGVEEAMGGTPRLNR